MQPIFKKAVPFFILLIAAAAYAALQFSAQPPLARDPQPKAVAVIFTTVRSGTVPVVVHSQGTVQACTETRLIADVTGKIIWVAPQFHTGGFFKKDSIMLEISSQEYRESVAQAKSNLAQAKLKLASERALALQAEQDWQTLGIGRPTDLVLRQPQLAVAEAELAAAQVLLESARQRLAQTRIRAPYTLMVRAKQAELGQYVVSGTPLSHVFSMDAAQVRLPVTDSDLTHLNLQLNPLHPFEKRHQLPVTLQVDLGKRPQKWRGWIVRSEGVYDPETHLTYLVARIEDPYGLISGRSGKPLAMGRFVQAFIQGRNPKNGILLPAGALVKEDSVWVIHADNTLQRRSVSWAYAQGDNVLIDKGLFAGDKVCLTRLDHAVEGLRVRPVPADNHILPMGGQEQR